jgi:hypothetical protein
MMLDDGGWLVAFDSSEPWSAKAQGCVLGSRIVAVCVGIDRESVLHNTVMREMSHEPENCWSR